MAIECDDFGNCMTVPDPAPGARPAGSAVGQCGLFSDDPLCRFVSAGAPALTAGTPANPTGDEKPPEVPFYKKEWFIPVAIVGGAVLLSMTGVLGAFFASRRSQLRGLGKLVFRGSGKGVISATSDEIDAIYDLVEQPGYGSRYRVYRTTPKGRKEIHPSSQIMPVEKWFPLEMKQAKEFARRNEWAVTVGRSKLDGVKSRKKSRKGRKCKCRTRRVCKCRR